jgi:3-oxoacyl-[acyl-carrier protein] reductase
VVVNAGGDGWWAQRSGLAGTVAVVTGGAGGLGAAITADLAANGVRLAVIDIDSAAASSLELSLAGHDTVVHAGDARDPDALVGLFTAVDSRWGRVDTLVNVVGGTFRAPFLTTSGGDLGDGGMATPTTRPAATWTR